MNDVTVAAWSSWHECQADGLPLGVGAVEFVDGPAGVADGGVGHVGCAVGSACAVVA